MQKQQVADLIMAERLIPIVRVAGTGEAMDVAEALRSGGARLIEITFTVQDAPRVIQELNRRYGNEIIFGAGTVLDLHGAKQAFLAGARFIVSPGLVLEVVRFALENGVTVIPGAMTPTEILNAWKAGADMVKVFPVGRLGGVDYIKSIRGPFPDIPLVPTGGVDLLSAGSYIGAGAAAIGVAGELVDKQSLAEKNFQRITEKTRAFLSAVRDAGKK